MKVISFNANGIRACYRRGFFSWFLQQNADVLCLQELKAQEKDLLQDCFDLLGYDFYYYPSVKPGYSGVGIYTRLKPLKVVYGLGWPVADDEGRYIEIELEGFSIASIYLPSGTSGPHRQLLKEQFMAKYYDDYLAKLASSDKKMIICGDWNIAHHEIDLKNWRANQKNTGFLPHERQWFTKCLNDAGLVDALRYLHPSKEEYTWWTYRGAARKNNVGWRLDYQIVTPNIASLIKSVETYNQQVFSDHAPVIVEYDW